MTLEKQIGRQVQAVIEDLGVPAERVAKEARRIGLPWSRATIKAVIQGRRRLNLGELLLLTEVLARAAGRTDPVPLEAFFPEDERYDVGGLLVHGRSLHRLLHGVPADPADLEPVMAPKRIERRLSARRVPGLTPEMLRDVAASLGVDLDDAIRDAAGEAEAKTATRLGTIPELVAIAARARWGTSMTMERDRLAQLRAVEGVGALGHLTRELAKKVDDELRKARVVLLRQLAPGREPALLIVEEAEEDVARRLSQLMRTLSELVVLAAYDRWGHGPAEELRQRSRGSGVDLREARQEREILDQIAVELAPDDRGAA